MTAPTTSSAKESQPSMSREIQPCCGDYSILKYPLPSLFRFPHPCSSMVPLQSIPSPSPSHGQEGVYQQISPTVAFHELVFTTSWSKQTPKCPMTIYQVTPTLNPCVLLQRESTFMFTICVSFFRRAPMALISTPTRTRRKDQFINHNLQNCSIILSSEKWANVSS